MNPLHPAHPSAHNARPKSGRAVRFKIFYGGVLTSWEELFAEAATFASTLVPGDVISISHSDSHRKGIVTVWYWSA